MKCLALEKRKEVNGKAKGLQSPDKVVVAAQGASVPPGEAQDGVCGLHSPTPSSKLQPLQSWVTMI